MSFSTTNPDVDRVSLDRRISALEDRFGPSGPGGGGGSIPGGTSVITGAVDFDRYPDNAWTEINEGLIFKLTINSSTPNATGFPANDEINLCGIFPKIYQFPLFDAIRPRIFARCKIASGFAFAATFNNLLSVQPVLDFFNLSLAPGLGTLSCFCCDLEGEIPTYDNPTNGQLQIQLLNQGDVRVTCDFRPIFGGNRSDFKGGVYYGVGRDIPSSAGISVGGRIGLGGNHGYGAYVETPQDLPKWFRQFYPKSWAS